MKAHLSKGLSDHILSLSPCPLLRDVIVLLVAQTMTRQRFAVHSSIIHQVLGGSKYTKYLHLMQSLPFISRDDSYLAESDAQISGKLARCKSWVFNGLLQSHTLGNIICLLGRPGASVVRRRGLVAWEFSGDFVERLSGAFDLYFLEHSVSPEQRKVFAEVLELVKGSLEALEPPDLTFDEVLALCERDAEKAQVSWDVLKKLQTGDEVSGNTHFRAGHRLYHPLTNVKKEIRRQFRLDGEPTVEVDMHATFPCIIAAVLATDGERERLIALCKSGDFYGLMAKLLGIEGLTKDDIKRLFQRDVVFTYRPFYSPVWQAFQREFPGTARALSQVRDNSENVVKTERRRDKNRQWHTVKTYWGQRRLSRILSRIESKIFLQRALVRLGRNRINSIPIHDCLMVAESNAAIAKREIEKAAREVLAFIPVVRCK